MRRVWLVLGMCLCFGAVVWAEDDSRIQQLEQKVDVLTQEIERLGLGEVGDPTYKPAFGFAPAAAKVYHVKKGVSIGGYGEAVYQDFDTKMDNGQPSGSRSTADFLRFVLYFGYKFTDKFVFNSEVEIEHAAQDKRGEVSVELATIDYLAHPMLNLRGGLLLLPMGFLNELHEPPIFHGAKRPNVEQRIIPTTWRENGVGVFGDLGPVAYRSYLVNGLQAVSDSALNGGAPASTDKVKGFNASDGLRNGRQKGSQAYAENLGWANRIDFVGLPGLLVGGSCYIGESGQNAIVSGQQIAVRTNIWELHGDYAWRGLELRGLYARIDLEDVALLNQAQGISVANNNLNQSIGEELFGGYVQVAYDVLSLWGGKQYLAPFVRYERYNTQARVPAGFSSNPANDRIEYTFGVTYKPILNIVLKGDYQNMRNKADTGIDQWNLALGYLF